MSATEERAKAEFDRQTATADGKKTEAQERAAGTNPTLAQAKGKMTEMGDQASAVVDDAKAKMHEMSNSADNKASGASS